MPGVTLLTRWYVANRGHPERLARPLVPALFVARA